MQVLKGGNMTSGKSDRPYPVRGGFINSSKGGYMIIRGGDEESIGKNCLKCSKVIVSTADIRRCPNDLFCLCVACSLLEHDKCPQCKTTLEPIE